MIQLWAGTKGSLKGVVWKERLVCEVHTPRVDHEWERRLRVCLQRNVDGFVVYTDTRPVQTNTQKVFLLLLFLHCYIIRAAAMATVRVTWAGRFIYCTCNNVTVKCYRNCWCVLAYNFCHEPTSLSGGVCNKIKRVYLHP